jgi:hypothetical protein
MAFTFIQVLIKTYPLTPNIAVESLEFLFRFGIFQVNIFVHRSVILTEIFL